MFLIFTLPQRAQDFRYQIIDIGYHVSPNYVENKFGDCKLGP
jgi:hypothetical protein